MSAPPPPSSKPDRDPIRSIRESAESGDFGGVIDWYGGSPPGTYSATDFDYYLRMAISFASHKSAPKFGAASYRQTTSFLMYVLGRLHIAAMDSLQTADRVASGRRAELPEELLRNILPHVERLSHLVGELNLSRASAARLWKLSGERKPRRKRAPKPCQCGELPAGDLSLDGIC